MAGVWPLYGLLVLLTLASCDSKSGRPFEDSPPINSELLRRGIGGEPSTLDPGQADDVFSFDVIRDLYEGLTTESAAGAVEPGVASRWSVDPTGTKYTFLLRGDAKWSNGQSVRAQDFVSAWRRVVDPTRASPVADLLRPIAHASEIIAGRLAPTALGRAR
jgi:oligopeptide transport system substrate-binding protein